MKHLLLFTGGIDSTVAYYFLRQKMKVPSVDLLYYSLHHKYNAAEVEAATHLAEIMLKDRDTFTVMENLRLGEYEEPDATIPGRNLVLVSLAAMHCPGPCFVYLPVQEGEQTIPDRSPEFFRQMNWMLSFILSKTVTVLPIFNKMTKQDVVSWFLDKAVEDSQVKRHILSCSFSCYSKTEEFKQCGECSACIRKYISFRYSDFEDDWDINWSKKPWLSPLYRKYYDDADSNKYPGRRGQQIIEVFIQDVISRRVPEPLDRI